MLKKRLLPAIAMLLISPLLPAATGPVTPAANSAPLMTRLAKTFLDLESTLDLSLRTGDMATFNALLDELFEVRVGAMPISPTPRAEWIKNYQIQAKTMAPLIMTEIAVRDLDPVAIVSFKSASDNGAPDYVFVVDVWRKQNEQWRLVARYADPANAKDAGVRGFGPPAIDLQKHI